MSNFNFNYDEVKMICHQEIDLRLNGKKYTPDQNSSHMFMMSKGRVFVEGSDIEGAKRVFMNATQIKVTLKPELVNQNDKNVYLEINKGTMT